MVSPFTLIAICAALVLGVMTPLVEEIHHLPPGSFGRCAIEREAVLRPRAAGPDREETGRAASAGCAVGRRQRLQIQESPPRTESICDRLTLIVRTWRLSPAAGERTVSVVFDPARWMFDASSDAL